MAGPAARHPLEATSKATSKAAGLRAGGAGRVGGGRQEPHPCRPRFAPSMAGSASSHSRCRSHALLRKPRAPSHQHPHAAAPDSGAPSTRRVNGACGSAEPCSAECFRQRPAALAEHGSALPMPAGPMATMDLSKVGRCGWAGALSAMDAAKRGRQDAALAGPRTAPPPGPSSAAALQPTARGSARSLTSRPPTPPPCPARTPATRRRRAGCRS